MALTSKEALCAMRIGLEPEEEQLRGEPVRPSVLPEDDGRMVWPEDEGHPSNHDGDDYTDYGGVLGADGNVYSDADPGL